MQDAALQMCESLAYRLKVLSADGKTGFQNIQNGVANILGAIGSVATSFTNDSALSSNTTEENAKVIY